MISRTNSFTEYVAISDRGNQNQEDSGNEIGRGEYAISTSGESAEAWREVKLNLEWKKEELSNEIELSLRFGGNLEQF